MNIGELTEKAVQSVRRKDTILGQGADGLVYAVDENLVLKLHLGDSNYYYHGSSRKSAEYEFNIGSDLYQQGVQVPQYFGLFEPIEPSFWKAFMKRISLCNSSPLNFWGVFMERIYGVRPNKLSNLLRREAERQYQQQQELLEELSYRTLDSSPYMNTLFDVQKNKLFLHDLVRWERNDHNT